MSDNPNAAELGLYSKRIRLLRKLLPVLALCLLAVLVVAANPDLRRSFSGASPDNDRLAITAPQFLGRLSDNRPFAMTAREGRQKADGIVVMTQADLLIDGDDRQGRIGFVAARADYDPGAAKVRLVGNVEAVDAQNNKLSSDEMLADLADGLLTASSITMTGPAGRITAKQMQADTKTLHYRFMNAVMRLETQAK